MEGLIAEHRVPRPAFPAGSLHSFFKDRGTPSHLTETNIQPPLCSRPSSLAGHTYSSINGTANSVGSADVDPHGAPMPQDSCYCKILVSNHLAGIIIGSSGNEIKNLKQTTGAKIVLSPHGMYFPGTTERLAAIEGSEQAVFQVVDWILEKMVAQAAAPGSASPASGSAAVASPPSLSASCSITDPLNATGLEQQPVRPAQCLRICVPRAVVGSLIGKNGGYIQSLRVATGACINISPLFVNADEACAERVVSVESKKKHRLKTAALTLIRKINAHPDKGSCRHVCYYRKHNFLGADLIQQQPQLLPRQQHSQTLEGREPPEAQRDELLQQQQTLLQQKPRLQEQSDEQQHHLLPLQQQKQSSEQPDPKLLKRPQPQHEPEQQAIDALRLRTVSLVLGTAKRDSAALSDSSGSSQFAAFRRFCESRNGAGATPELAAAAQRRTPAEAPASAAARISCGSGTSKASETPLAILGASGAAHAKTTMSFESLSTVCSSTTGSTDRLPSIRDITIVAAEGSSAGSAAVEREARGSERPAVAEVAAPQEQAAAAASNHELRQLLQLGMLFALLLSVVLHLFVQLFK